MPDKPFSKFIIMCIPFSWCPRVLQIFWRNLCLSISR